MVPTSLWLSACIFMYVRPVFYVRPAKTFYIDKSLTVFYTVITPMLNPLIYSLRNSKFRLKLKKVGKTTRPFRYDLNQIPYDYTVEVRNRFKDQI